ncbi:MAG: hypothetical protein RR505_03465 [Raoultibacter sp.]
MDRRNFVKGTMMTGALLAGGFITSGCASSSQGSSTNDLNPDKNSGMDTGGVEAEQALPPAQPDPKSAFGVDQAIYIDTIDQWLGRSDVVYRDVRMLFDTADFAAIGGDPDLSATIEGFKVVSFPLLATMPALPVAGAYSGPAAWTVTWAEDGSIVAAEPAYWESELLLEELFPKDKAIFILCGAGAYAGLTKDLLVYLGWDAEKLYNVGGFWSYRGERKVELIKRGANPDGSDQCCMWRVDCAPIDFARMHVREGSEAVG